MAKRTKKSEIEANGDESTATFEPSSTADATPGPLDGPPFEPENEAHAEPELEAPSIEDRLAKLEAELSESNRIIRQQASAIAIGVENAERLRKSRERVDRLTRVADERKKEAAQAKKSLEAAIDEHFRLEAELDSPQARLPFPPPEPETSNSKAPEPDTPATPSGSGTPDDDSWRSVPLGQLGITDELPPSLVEKLADAGLRTIGDLADFVKPGPTGHSKRLTDIPGIGAAKAEAIEEASMAFWQSRSLDAQEVNRELLEGVEEIEARRRLEAMEPDDCDEDEEEIEGFEPTREEEAAAWARGEGII